MGQERIRKRTAVVVVHGMGNQRAQDTVRGVVRAVWHNSDAIDDSQRVWTHPARLSGVDIDLAVMTTSHVAGSADERSVDFHELYWAHLMSETKAIAVLLWLYELGRRGPLMQPGMNGLWWFAAVFLCLLNLSLALLILRAIIWSSGIAGEPYALILTPLVMALVSLLFALAVTMRYPAPRLKRLLSVSLAGVAGTTVVLALVAVLIGCMTGMPWSIPVFFFLATLLPPAVALLATVLLMGRWGLRAFRNAYLLAWGFFVVYAIAIGTGVWTMHGGLGDVLRQGWLPWSLTSTWSVVAAWIIVGLYLLINAVFLQSVLGDAARYFRNAPANVAVRREIRRQAVAMLEELHLSGRYDRIVIVAHSLGTVVAYDMLRTYYSRVCQDMPADALAGDATFEALDREAIDAAALRTGGRALIRRLAELSIEPAAAASASASSRDCPPSQWLVTDFITLGSPLTHVKYLMCRGGTRKDLDDDFARRVRERDLPTCPPQMLDGDGRLTYSYRGKRIFHHGGMFALTRWTNIYFPLTEILWGDAIGGPVSAEFGGAVPGAAVDVELPLAGLRRDGFFTHTIYWDVEQRDGRKTPHVQCLRLAVDLADTGAGNDPAQFAAVEGVKASVAGAPVMPPGGSLAPAA